MTKDTSEHGDGTAPKALSHLFHPVWNLQLLPPANGKEAALSITDYGRQKTYRHGAVTNGQLRQRFSFRYATKCLRSMSFHPPGLEPLVACVSAVAGILRRVPVLAGVCSGRSCSRVTCCSGVPSVSEADGT